MPVCIFFLFIQSGHPANPRYFEAIFSFFPQFFRAVTRAIPLFSFTSSTFFFHPQTKFRSLTPLLALIVFIFFSWFGVARLPSFSALSRFRVLSRLL